MFLQGSTKIPWICVSYDSMKRSYEFSIAFSILFLIQSKVCLVEGVFSWEGENFLVSHRMCRKDVGRVFGY